MVFDGERVLRWTARILGSLVALLYIVLFVGEAIAEPPAGLSLASVLILSTHALTVVGFLVAWRWPILGGTLAVLGAGWRLPVILLDLAPQGVPTPFLVFVLIGALHIVDGLLQRRRRTRGTRQDGARSTRPSRRSGIER